MTEPAPPANPDAAAAREARISELSVGFALGELGDVELRELYDYLREPGDAGAAAARLAWQQLGVVTDLRSGLGALFQDEIRHRISGLGKSDRFTSSMRVRLGMEPPGLQPVAAAPSRRQLSLWPFLLLAVLIFLGALAVAAIGRGPGGDTVCEVSDVQGEATLGGEVLVAGARIDRRQVVVPTGSQLSLRWMDGSRAVIAGPANAVAQTAGLSLTNGAAWASARAGFVCGLPDDTIRADPGCVFAFAVEDNRSRVGVARGHATLTAMGLEAGRASSGGTGFAWTHVSGAVADDVTSDLTPEWRYCGTIVWKDAADRVELSVRDPQAERLRLRFAPGRLIVDKPGETSREIPLAGPPMIASPLNVSVHRGRLSLERSGAKLVEEQVPGSSGIAVVVGATSVKDVLFHTGPAPAPPLAVAGWPDF
ncbi:MAG: hypothetical protein H0V44_03485 [Planctomycetes bacterium]|nr:hypothetical protein [Planctomycetota bacterium]